jgi:hypothetical protein
MIAPRNSLMAGLKSFAMRPTSAIFVCLFLCTGLIGSALGQGGMMAPTDGGPYAGLPVMGGAAGYPATGMAPAAYGPPAMYGPQQGVPVGNPNPCVEPSSASMIVPADNGSQFVDADVYCQGQPGMGYPGGPMLTSPSDVWDWQVLPQGLIYRSYWAGVKEPRLSMTLMHISGEHSFWEPTVGARVGILRFGTTEGLHPQGWEIDAEGAAEPRLTLDRDRDLETVDFRGGAYLTYGIEKWQFKFGYYHLSSHLGDELAIKDPAALADRINYVRDSLILGASYYPNPAWRL